MLLHKRPGASKVSLSALFVHLSATDAVLRRSLRALVGKAFPLQHCKLHRQAQP